MRDQVVQLINKTLQEIARLLRRIADTVTAMAASLTSVESGIAPKLDYDPILLTLTVGSNTFSSLGYAINPNVASVIITNRTGADIFYENDGTAADATNYPLRDTATIRIYGDADIMSAVAIFSAVGGDIGVVQELTTNA